jgi:hypothetical protein
MKILFVPYILICLLIFSVGVLFAQKPDLSRAEIIASPKIKSPVRETAIKVLQEEVAKRTNIKLQHVLQAV